MARPNPGPLDAPVTAKMLPPTGDQNLSASFELAERGVSRLQRLCASGICASRKTAGRGRPRGSRLLMTRWLDERQAQYPLCLDMRMINWRFHQVRSR
jgi:hypothetical protein